MISFPSKVSDRYTCSVWTFFLSFFFRKFGFIYFSLLSVMVGDKQQTLSILYPLPLCSITKESAHLKTRLQFIRQEICPTSCSYNMPSVFQRCLLQTYQTCLNQGCPFVVSWKSEPTPVMLTFLKNSLSVCPLASPCEQFVMPRDNTSLVTF